MTTKAYIEGLGEVTVPTGKTETYYFGENNSWKAQITDCTSDASDKCGLVFVFPVNGAENGQMYKSTIGRHSPRNATLIKWVEVTVE